MYCASSVGASSVKASISRWKTALTRSGRLREVPVERPDADTGHVDDLFRTELRYPKSRNTVFAAALSRASALRSSVGARSPSEVLSGAPIGMFFGCCSWLPSGRWTRLLH